MNKRSKLINDSLYNLKDLKSIFNYNINRCQDINSKINETTDYIFNELSSINILGTFIENNSFKQYTKNDLTNCIFYYEDNTNNIISNYKSLSFNELCSFNEYSIAPYLAEKIGVYLNNDRIGEITLGHLKVNYNQRLYRVGLSSDWHYDDTTFDEDPYTVTESWTEYDKDALNALDFYENNEDVKFICSAGDITTNYIVHILNFEKLLEEHSPNTHFYSCFGNHDYCCSQDNYNEEELINIGFNIEGKTSASIWNDIFTNHHKWSYELHYQNLNTDLGKSSYWFEVPIQGTNKSDIYLFLSVNYNNRGASATEHLSLDDPYLQDIIDYVGYKPNEYDLQFYDNETLIWLKNILEEYKEKRIFIFTHQFFIHKAGSNNINPENYFQYGGEYDTWRRNPESTYCLFGLQFEFLNKLNNEYKNTIWFTGHSHYKWNWQTIDPHININDNEYNIYREEDNNFKKLYLRKSNEPIGKSGFNVHLPSISRPIEISSYNAVIGNESEGGVMDVYEDYVDIRGIVFKDNNTPNNYCNKYYPLANYRINIKAN